MVSRRISLPRVVGIDQSYSGFGYCHSGVSIKKAFPGKVPITRLLAVEDWLTARLMEIEGDIDLVAMEGYANATKFGREMAGELGYAVKRTVWLVTGNAPLIVPPSSLKKYVSGNGNAPKNTMIAHTFRKWGVMFNNDNQADAFGLEKFGLDWIKFEAGNTEGMLKYEIEAIEAVRKKME